MVAVQKNENLLKVFKKSWQLIAPYWKSEEKYLAWTLLILSIFLSLGWVWIKVRLNKVTLELYNALEQKNSLAFLDQIYVFLTVICFLGVLIGLRNALEHLLEFKWRRWLTNTFLNKWTKSDLYYHALLKSDRPDNPDQRISEDLSSLSSLSITLFLQIMMSAVSFCSFSVILWNLSHTLPLKIKGIVYTIPGYLLWLTLIYAIIGTLINIKLGKPLIALNFLKEKYEANLRYSLIRIQEKREEIALFHGIKSEVATVKEHFVNIRNNRYSMLTRAFYLDIYSAFYGNLAQLIPLVLASPLYFSSLITLGVLMQISSAFTQVVDSLSVLVTQFYLIASWRTAAQRLMQFHHYLENTECEHKTSKLQIKRKGNQIILRDINIYSPNREPLLKKVSFTIKQGDKVLLLGASGIGKSTLVKALAGLWIYGEGLISLPNESIFFVPQRPYMPICSLRNAVSYPLISSTQQNDHEIKRWLNLFKLDHLSQSLEENKDWGLILSLGEQQRISFIRILLYKPKWIVMDEPTSALNEELQCIVFEALIQTLKDTSIITIGHNKNLQDYHSSTINLDPYAGKA